MGAPSAYFVLAFLVLSVFGALVAAGFESNAALVVTILGAGALLAIARF